MKKGILRTLLSRWVLSFLILVQAALAVWFLGPFLPVLEGVAARLVVILVLVLVWLSANLLLDRRRQAREAALAAGVAGTGGGEGANAAGAVAPAPAGRDAAGASAEENAALREKLTTALSLLRRARGTRGYLYEQPWYAFIGPPGAGKTTALLNAGLRFPLAAEMGQAPVPGVGGTRLCEWLFADEAVLIDTAGRYTTQDSDAQVDRAGWEGFLDLLRRTRPRQPLNGAIVAISLAEIATAPAEDRKAHARAIRRRLKELEERLQVRLPVYALLTKADLLAGFTEFFDDLDRERRTQVWGTTFGVPAKGAERPEGAVAGFAAEFGALVERLNARLFDRIQAERTPDRRALIAGFPAQVASLQAPLQEFLQEAFGGSRLDAAPFLRGVYLASGTQEGTPIDRMTGVLARTFGLDQRRLPSLRPEGGRAYFLERLLKTVVFGEAMLVSERPGAARRRRLAHAAVYAACLLGLLALGGTVWVVRGGARADVSVTDAAVEAYRKAAAPVATDPVTEADLRRVAPLLDQARALPHGYDQAGAEGSRWHLFGLSQAAKLEAGSRAIYRQAVERLLLPRLVWRLESQMRANLGRPDFLYEATRVYLMLGSQGPLDRDLVREWMAVDWQGAYPGPAAASLRDSLGRHLDALLRNPLPPVELDGGLVAAARATFSRVPLASRVYSRIRPSAAAQAVPPWRPADALGPAGVRVFFRPSGKPLTDGVPGFYTVDGFHRVLLPALDGIAKDVAAESWVLGERQELDPASPQMRALERDVVQLYEAEYVKAWDGLLADIDPVPLRSGPQAAQDLYILSSPQSPMRDLLAGVARQLTLSQPPAPGGVAGTAQAVAQGVANAAIGSAQAAERMLAARAGIQLPGAGPQEVPGHAIDDRYKALRDYVGSGPGAPIDQTLKVLNDLQQGLARLNGLAPGATPPAPTGDDPANALRAEALRAPQPVQRWLAAMVTGGTALRSGNAKQLAAAAFNASGGPAQLCQQSVTGRYPFAPGAQNDIPLDNFAQLFKPDGVFDQFFNAQLRPYVDTTGPAWKPQAAGGIPAPISAADLAQFQRAAAIRDMFFAGGAAGPSVRLEITPQDLDSGANQVTLDLGGDAPLTWAHGPVRPTSVTWPGPNRASSARLVFDPAPAGKPAALQANGPWALFRLIGQGTLKRDNAAELYTLTLQQGERRAVFQIRAGSVVNPLAPGVLQDFKCPTLQP